MSDFKITTSTGIQVHAIAHEPRSSDLSAFVAIWIEKYPSSFSVHVSLDEADMIADNLLDAVQDLRARMKVKVMLANNNRAAILAQKNIMTLLLASGPQSYPTIYHELKLQGDTSVGCHTLLRVMAELGQVVENIEDETWEAVKS